MALPKPRAFWPVTIAAGVNDKVDFRVSPTTYAGTVAPGTYYSVRELLDAVLAACVAALGAGAAWYATPWPVGANLLTAPEDLTNAAWNKNNCTATAATDADPAGDSTIDTITDNAVNAAHWVEDNFLPVVDGDPAAMHAIVSAGTKDRCWMCWVGNGGTPYGAAFLLTGAGSVTHLSTGFSASIIGLGGGWYRIIVETSQLRDLIAGNSRCGLGIGSAGGLAENYLGDGTGSIKAGWIKAEKSAKFSGYQPQALATQADGHVTIMRGAATLEFLFGTGANKAVSVHRALGFKDEDRAAAVVHTSNYQHQNGWYAERPVVNDTGDLPVYERALARALGGQTYALDFGTRYDRAIGLAMVADYKSWKANEGVSHVNEALERLFDNGWMRFRWWPDASVEATYEDLVLDAETAKRMPRNRLSPAKALYSFSLGCWKYVAP